MAGKINKGKVIAAAQKHMQKGQHDRAIREYTKIVQEDPRDVRIWLKIGDLQAKKGSIDEAVDTYLKVAEFYSEQGFYLKAVAVYKQILKLNHALVDVNLRLAELYKQLGLLNDAMQRYELVSNHFHQAGRTRDALAALGQIVELDPENVASRIKLAELYSKEEMRDEAIAEFSKAADFLRASNRLDDFVKVAERLVYHQPDNVPIVKELASLYLRREDPRRALQKLQVAFKADPRAEDTLEMLAQSFQNLGQVPKTISVWKELAQIHRENGQNNKEQEVFERILELAPQDAEAHQALQGLRRPAGGAPPPPPLPPMNAPAPGQHISNAGPISNPGPHGSSAAPPPPPLDSTGPFGATDVSRPSAAPPAIPESGMSAPGMSAPGMPAASMPVPGIPVPGMPGPAPGMDEAPQDRVARVLTEAEVYIKYGLHDKAAEHLREIFVDDPDNVEVRLKLRDLHTQAGRYAEAALELFHVGRLLANRDRRSAAQYLNEALDLDPQHAGARQLLEEMERTGSSIRRMGTQVDAIDDDVPIDLDADDIVEEIPIDTADLLEDSGLVQIETEDADIYGSGVIELRGEATDTIGGTTPAAEVIPLPAAGQPIEVYHRVQQEEEPTGLEDDLEEADFFMQQNLYTEARTIIDELVKRYPGHPLVTAKSDELASAAGVVAVDTQAELVSSDSAVIDLLEAELGESFDDIIGDAEVQVDNVDYSVEDVFHEFKRGVDDQISEEDSDTHYDLGIAYREMGLLDDAITEFKVAMRSREKEVLCHMMIGLCYNEKGLITEAISQFKSGLYVEGISERETIALYFELGQAYERLDDAREALYYYEKVAKKDPRFRDVDSHIKRLKQSIGEGEGGPMGGGSGGGGSMSMLGDAEAEADAASYLKR